MKILSCFIETYGKIEKTKFDFSDGLTSIVGENGAGKTTLASFLMAMFYGLPPTKANSVAFNDRERFYPFSGGKFGGSLTYEVGGKTYKIERFFDKKSVNKDTVKLYENGEEIPAEYSLGLKLFGVDERAFTRTVFCGNDFVGDGEDAAAKLSDFVEDGDGVSYDDARGALESARKKYKAARGDQGIIKDLKAVKRNAEERIENYAKIERDLADKYDEKAIAEKSAAEIKARYAKAMSAKEVKAKRATYDGKKKELTAAEDALNMYKQEYPRGIPQKTETDEFAAAIADRAVKAASLSASAFSPENAYRLSTLERDFSVNPLDDEKLLRLGEKVESLAAERAEVLQLNESAKRAGEEPLVRKFDTLSVDTDEYDAIKAKMNDFRDAEEKRRLVNESSAVAPPKKRSMSRVVVSIFGLVALAVGIGLAFVNTYVGVGIAVAGLTIAVLPLILPKHGAQTADNTAIELAAECRRLEDEIKSFTVRYGYYSVDGVRVDFSNFDNDYNRYLGLKNAEGEKIAAAKRAAKDFEAKENALAAEFTRYGAHDGDMRARLKSLERKYDEYLSLTRERNACEKRVAALKKEISEDDKFIADFLSAYKLVGDNSAVLERLRVDRIKSEELKARVSVLKGELAGMGDFAAEEITEDSIPAEELSRMVDDANAKIAKINADIAAYETTLEDYPDAKSAAEAAEEDIAAAIDKYELLGEVVGYLDKAEKKLKDEYVAPTLKSFETYVRAISAEFGENAEMDKNFRVKFERGGELRDEKYFSAGQRAVISLCLRLALIDRTFKGEKPFVVLDDPFTAVDGERFGKVKETVKKLAQKIQIIYFTCHDSRNI